MDFVRWYLSSYWYKCIVVPGTGQLKWYTTDHCGSDIECSHWYTAGLNQLLMWGFQLTVHINAHGIMHTEYISFRFFKSRIKRMQHISRIATWMIAS